MPINIWKKIKTEIPIWRKGAIPGLAILGLIIIARLTGLLQSLEWTTLDLFLRLRPPEPIDERITIIGINDQDITDVVGKYPIPDRDIANLIKTLQKYQPRVIGLDNVRDIPVDVGYHELVEVFKNTKNLIAIEKVLPLSSDSSKELLSHPIGFADAFSLPIKPPKELPPEQIGFSDAIPDKDGKYRRSLLGIPTPQGYKFSLALRLAETYLAGESITLENGIRDLETMRFGLTELPRFFPNSGGYIGTDAGGVKVLLNYRSGRDSFRQLSLQEIRTGKFNPDWLRNRIIIIGITALSAPDLVNTSAISGLKLHGQIYGVEFQAHSTSQIISAVLDKRPLLRTWSDEWEYLWILAWGILAITIGRLTQSAFNNLFFVGIASIFILGIGYVFILFGWWLPIAPTLLILATNAVGISAFAFYEYDRSLRLQLEERQGALKEAFDAIHNGPLQELASLLRKIRSKNCSEEKLLSQLEKINLDTREISDYLQEKSLSHEEIIRLGSGLKVDLKNTVDKLFYEVYRETVQRDLPCFQTLKLPIVEFAPIEPEILSIEQKRLLCQFLEEALCNIGKHAQGVTRIEVTGKQKEGLYILSIKDNGVGLTSSQENQGTKNAKELAKKLPRGEFKRKSLTPSGVLCELTWKV